MAESKPLPVFLTGASRGIGAATAREFAKRGHPIALSARNKEAIEKLAQEIRAAGGIAAAVPCDVGDPAQVERAIASAVAQLGGLGIVINNAGTIEPLARIADADMRQWARAMEINLNGPIYVMHYAARHLPRGSVVINITSGAAERPQTGRSAYAASKAGLMIASRVFAIEESESHGIRVIGFSPGYVDTEMNTLNRIHRMGNAGNINPADLRPPAETAQLIAWLTGPDAAHLNGTIVTARDPDIRRAAGVAALVESR
jgi:NAD(P)-dependent dehydrogenase (short-subunit alcohol dehydrogenase family)